MPMRAMAVSKDDLAFGREYTNLSAEQADALRSKLAMNKKLNLQDGGTRPWRMPRLPGDRVRAYFSLIEKREPPRDFLEHLAVTSDVPETSKAALALAKKFNLDLRMIPGTGANGMICEKDVRETLEKIAAEMASEEE